MIDTNILQALCQQALPVVRKAGAFIKGELGKVASHEVEIKSLNSLVSYVDRGAEEILVSGLRSLLPEAGFFTEEDTVTNDAKPLRWIIDPLDGTTNFLFQLPVFSVSVGLEADGELVLGIVYEINQDECFYAWKNGGAYLNDHPIRVSHRNNLKESLIATGFPYYDYALMDQYFKAMTGFIRETRGLRRLGSAAVDLAYVACGRFDAFFEYSLSLWDIAGGIVLVREAGGKVTDFRGREEGLSGKEVLACSAQLYEASRRIVEEAFYEKS